MAVPKQRHTKSRQQKRRMHIFLKPKTLRPCQKCGVLVPSHIVCPNCGYYKNKEVLNILEKLEKKERKKREKEMKEKEKEEKKKPLTIEELSKKKL
ncbi:MAG: 50S ribosomal protein L32 [Minisyncoccia bacterium]